MIAILVLLVAFIGVLIGSCCRKKDNPQPTSDQPVGYEILIHKALEEGKLRHFIIGYGEYYIPSRDERFQNLTDYVVLLWDFNGYHAKYPDSNLKEIYESALE